MKCKQCGAEFQGKFCPECGAKAEAAPTLTLDPPAAGQGVPEEVRRRQKVRRKKPFFLRWWFILLVLIAVIVGVSSCRGRKDDGAGPEPEVRTEAPVSTPAPPEKTAKPEPAEPAESEPADEEEADDNSLDPDFKAAMDSYEAFIDEYVAFMEKYAASDGSDLSLLADYASYMSQYMELAEAFEEWEDEDMNTAETSYYIEVQARVAQKLLTVAG